jgi:hypothetical protein
MVANILGERRRGRWPLTILPPASLSQPSEERKLKRKLLLTDSSGPGKVNYVIRKYVNYEIERILCQWLRFSVMDR